MASVRRNRVSQEHLLKQLQELDKRLLQLDIQQDEADLERKQLRNEKRKLENDIDSFYFICDGVRVTEHAVLRYLERVRNIDINLIVEEMLMDESVCSTIKVVGSGIVPISDKHAARVIDNTIITILKKESKDE